MRINKYLALTSGLSRRKIDELINNSKVSINGKPAVLGQSVTETDIVELDNQIQKLPKSFTTIMLHKPAGYVVSRNPQGGKSIYELIDKQYSKLKPVGRLDKDSSGLLILTNDGNLANELTHPSVGKSKQYIVKLDHQLQPLHHQMISDKGISLDDGVSKFAIQKNDDNSLSVTLKEGRNRQIRRTFAALGYEVIYLHRVSFGPYSLGALKPKEVKQI